MWPFVFTKLTQVLAQQPATHTANCGQIQFQFLTKDIRKSEFTNNNSYASKNQIMAQGDNPNGFTITPFLVVNVLLKQDYGDLILQNMAYDKLL